MSEIIHRPIALIGFPSSGKSTLGMLLAQALGIPWLDSDKEIETSTGHPPAYWLQTQGEPAFRAIERQWLENWQPQTACVLSTGGGLPCFQDNLTLLRTKALTVYLESDFATLYQRLITPPGHALTRLYDSEGLKQLYAQRAKIYQQADLRLPVEGNPEATLKALLLVL